MELRSPGEPLSLSEREALRPGPGELLLDIEACAVCRTDLQISVGDLAAKRLPIVPGHQVVGRAVQVGEGVASDLLGRRCGVGWLAGSCHRCEFCRRGLENLCLEASFTGWDRDGGFASQLLVRSEFAFGLPEEGDPVELAPLLCGGVIGYRAFRLTGAGPNDRLGLFGFGASALLVAQLALAEGCRVFVSTRGEAAKERAREAGAEWVGGLGEAPPEPLQGAITFAPVGSVVVDALRAVDRGGVVVVNAIHLDTVPEFPYQLLYWERTVRSVANFTRQDAREFLGLAAAIPIRTQVERFPLASANEALRRLASDRIQGAAVLVL